MPTLKPRISITLDHDELVILDRYAAASGTPRASIVADLLRSTLPQLKEAADLIEMANAAPGHIKQGLIENLSNATADAMGFLQPFNADYQHIIQRLGTELHLANRYPLPPAKVQAYADTNGRPPKAGGDASSVPASDGRPGRKNPRSLTGGSEL